MEITNGSDFIVILNLEDIKGQPLRVADTVKFKLYVWTTNRNNYLEFDREEILTEGNVDRVAIPELYMNTLESGVICYSYDYGKWDSAFHTTDCIYNKVKVVTTDVYWQNRNFNQNPAKPINYQTVDYLKKLIYNERIAREEADRELNQYVNIEFTDKLNKEIKRSNEVDIEFHKLIKANKEAGDAADTEILNKLDKEIKRSNEVDIEFHKLLKENQQTNKDELNAAVDASNAKIDKVQKDLTDSLNELNDTVVVMVNDAISQTEREKSRAMLAEDTITNNLNIEVNRAKAAEEIIANNLTAETERATAKEKALKDSIDELVENLGDEIERSLEKDREYK